MNNLSCDIVTDLLPLYVDHLTAPESEKQIKEHLAACESCRKVYEQMTAGEPRAKKETRKVDVFKKIKKSHLRVVVCLVLVALAAILGQSAYFKASAVRATVTYNALTRSVVVCGTSNYADLKFTDELKSAANLEVQDDDFHLAAYLPVLKTDHGHIQDFLPGYLDKTDKSLPWLQNYLRENAPDCYSADDAAKFVELTIRKTSDNDYSYANEEDRIVVELGSFYWHREELYLFALMNTDTVEWPQLGYAWYLGSVLNPYSDMADGTEGLRYSPYYDTYLKAGGNPEPASQEDLLKLFDAISRQCLKKGMGWGSAYESLPLYKTGFFTGAKNDSNGNGMSVSMATSFIAWLTGQYGFENVSSFCFGRMSFDEAFHTSFDEAYESWSEWILSTYA